MPNQHFNKDVSPTQLAEALLSGSYNHHKGTLKHAHKDAHCCLGVALVLSDPVDPTALDSMYLYGWIDLLGLFKLRYTERTTNVIPNTFAPWLMNIQSSLGNLNDSQISDVWPDVIVPFLLALDVDDEGELVTNVIVVRDFLNDAAAAANTGLKSDVIALLDKFISEHGVKAGV